MGPRYRWVVLAVGAFGAAAFTALRMGFPALGPELRDVFGLSLGEIGLAIAALSIGVMLTTVPWGMLTDRIGERPVLAGGLFATSLAIFAMAFTEGFPALLVGLFVAGTFGASATGASGRAVMGWFTRHERGYALGIRQMALPVGGSLGSIALPLLAGAGGLKAAFLASGGLVLTGAIAAALFMRDAPPAPPGAYVSDAPRPLRDPRILRLGVASGLLVCAQAAVLGFIVLFLHDEEGLSAAFAAVLLAGLQLAGAVGRIVAGRRSDREERRIMPMRRHALAATGLIVASAVLTPAPNWVVVPLVMVAGRRDHVLERARVHRRRGDLRARAGRHGHERAEHDDRGRDRHRAGGVRRLRRVHVLAARVRRARGVPAGGMVGARAARRRGGAARGRAGRRASRSRPRATPRPASPALRAPDALLVGPVAVEVVELARLVLGGAGPSGPWPRSTPAARWTRSRRASR